MKHFGGEVQWVARAKMKSGDSIGDQLGPGAVTSCNNWSGGRERLDNGAAGGRGFHIARTDSTCGAWKRNFWAVSLRPCVWHT